MTPEEAVAELTSGIFADGYSRSASPGQRMRARRIIDACVVTAKDEAEKAETLRCAAFLAQQMEELKGAYSHDVAAYLGRVRTSILTTGGLEAEL